MKRRTATRLRLMCLMAHSQTESLSRLTLQMSMKHLSSLKVRVRPRAIAENVPADINIGSAVAATDPEKSILTYTLGGTDAASFSIDDATGQLKTTAALDYEDKDTYSVTITVSDGSFEDTITVTITVLNLDETLSNTPPVFEEGTSTTRSVAENTESRTKTSGHLSLRQM